ncbi:uncharacterized protein APUU_12310A [Aspergillus puulaauensis]|uniref:Uncharacterized protein n=1 Tax=Aspergillus puulaauensis TaxID=1220207 RepID=A0A7R8AIH9_9EURO|nr:uncharacterized protein APUU_12310A [Aspergillus puulaauensis]BCS19482.1 hypothetical protein APUU_12310A [Aspergillus puulaauensis]
MGCVGILILQHGPGVSKFTSVQIQFPSKFRSPSTCTMDARHGFTQPAYVRFLKENELKLQAAESRKGQRPEMMPSRDMTIMQFVFQQIMPSNNPINPNSDVLQSYHQSMPRLSPHWIP